MEFNLKYCFPTKDIFGHVYKKPHSMHEGDFNWRVLQQLNCASDLNMNDLICVLIVVSRKI